MRNELPQRRSVRLQLFDYGAAGDYFITVCTYEQRECFGHIRNGVMCLNALGALVWDEWQKTFEKRVDFSAGAFIVMPNHWHGIVCITRKPEEIYSEDRIEVFGGSKKDTLATMLKGMKAAVTSRADKEYDFAGKLWQRGFYDHVVRDAAAYEIIDHYIRNNPGKWQDDCFHP